MHYKKTIGLSFLTVLFLTSAIIGTFFVFNPEKHEVSAQTQCDTATVHIIARNDDGSFIPNINVGLYAQVPDADGKPKPAASVASGKTSAISGRATMKFQPNDHTYAVKLFQQDASAGASYFYDTLEVGCGQTVEESYQLAGIHVILRNSQGDLRKNKDFSIFTQRYDVDGIAIKDKFVGTFNTSANGEATAYVADGPRAIDGNGNGQYVFQAAGIHGGTFVKKNVQVSNARTTDLEYKFSDFAFSVKTADGVVFPANTKVTIYKQAYDHDNETITGAQVGEVLTDDKGVAFFEYPEGTYVARVIKEDGTPMFFWDLEMKDQVRQNITLQTGTDFLPSVGSCEKKSKVTVTARNLDGNFLRGIKFELRVQEFDIDGKPFPGALAAEGAIATDGEGNVFFNPDPRKSYILKMYHKSATAGDFWFYDNIEFSCGEDKTFTKTLPAIKFVLRNGNGSLLKGQEFSIYTQQFDIDGHPLKEKKDLVATMSTSEEGTTRLYVAPDHKYNPKKRGTYVFASKYNSTEYVEYNIKVESDRDIDFEYTFSDLFITLVNGHNNPLGNRDVSIYNQRTDINGNLALGDKPLATLKTNALGTARFQYPAGTYALTIQDAASNTLIFWNVEIENRKRTEKRLTAGTAEIRARGSTGNPLPEKTQIFVYSLIKDSKTGLYYKNKQIVSGTIGVNGTRDVLLRPGPYLFTVKEGDAQYGEAHYIGNSQLLNVELEVKPENKITVESTFSVSVPATPTTPTVSKPIVPAKLVDRVKGYILLQVEEHGEAWYVDHDTAKRFYMKDGPTAYTMLRTFGLGITNKDLNSIPIGFEDRFVDVDTDGDGLPDQMEDALGTDVYDSDSDDDGFTDGEEIRNGYSPLEHLGPPLQFNSPLISRLHGKILLQVESHGEAWYVNPADGKRYYMKNGDSAYQIMRFLSLGITNSDLNQIPAGSF